MKHIITATVVIVVVAAAFFAGQSLTNGATAEDLEAEFDRGMKAGQEYESWFCENRVTTPSTNPPSPTAP